MIDFIKRSLKKELLDKDDIPFEDIALNMKELNFINKYLGGHSITIHAFKRCLKKKRQISVCEIGCGGGDNLNVIDKYCTGKNIECKFIGIDINRECIEYTKQTKIKNVELIVSDYKNVEFKNEKPDIIFSSLFCHHFSDNQLVEMLLWMKNNSTIGFFINDLQRHPLAYYSIKFLTKAFSKSYLVKNDAPLSVLRGFKKNEWIQILNIAGIKNYKIKWKWAFRYVIIVQNVHA